MHNFVFVPESLIGLCNFVGKVTKMLCWVEVVPVLRQVPELSQPTDRLSCGPSNRNWCWRVIALKSMWTTFSSICFFYIYAFCFNVFYLILYDCYCGFSPSLLGLVWAVFFHHSSQVLFPVTAFRTVYLVRIIALLFLWTFFCLPLISGCCQKQFLICSSCKDFLLIALQVFLLNNHSQYIISQHCTFDKQGEKEK